MKRTATTFFLLLFLFIISIDSHSVEKKTIPSLTMEQIANATIFIEDKKVKLKNGHYEKRKKGSDTLLVDLTTWVKFTDLDKDGSEDAAVIFVWNKGGEEIFYELAAVLNKKGKAKHISSVDLGDRVVIKSLEMQSDTVQLDMLTHGEGDENCCPTVPTMVRYNFQDEKLIEQKRVEE